jgi:hypothetical protein
MKIDLRLSPQTLMIIVATLQPIYNNKPQTRRDKSTVSIALDLVSKLESKTGAIKKQSNLFDEKKTMKVTLKHHEADMLELLLIQQIKDVDDNYIRLQIQKTIDVLNQKLA